LKYDVYEKGGTVILEGVRDFDPVHIFECGQAFRWDRESDNSYTGVAMGRVINIKMDGDRLYINNSTIEDYEKIWHNYFDMDRDYGDIKRILSKDPVLKEAIKFGEGIRILKQDKWETLISFIISANNRIPMIKRAIKKISEKWGSPIKYEGHTYYSFPGPEELKDASIEELEECNTGFRAKYIKATTEMILSGTVDLYYLDKAGYEDARKELLKLPGVGPKVSDCILLFSMGYYEAFPVDVWVKRIMGHFYLAPDVSLPKIEKYAKDMFGDLAGFAQQYLFYYARDMKGKEIVK